MVRLLIGVLLIVGFAISGFHRSRALRADSSVSRNHEPLSTKLVRAATALPFFALLATNLIAPSWVTWSWVAVPGWVEVGGLSVLAVALGLIAWLFPHLAHNVTPTTLVKETATLVTTGPYRYVRHPLYLGGTAMMLGAASALGNWVMLLFVCVFGVAWRFHVVPREEQALRARFGERYDRYRASTPALIPRLRARA